jgi:hypothetical protein
MNYYLDLTRFHFRHVRGEIAVYGTWLLGIDSGPVPCLVLVPAHRTINIVPCVVPLNHAWVWSEEKGDPREAARMALVMAETLGLGVSPSSGIKVRSIVIDHIEDLLKIPPMPSALREPVVIGEAKVTAREHGKVVRHHEVIERV